ncbi:MBOAT family protein [Pendulispora rubella]|uniref:MBOAT family protein n=1 Tax=Pendulispora rubella TaxID=2741070 RepID=A0ABZ2KWA7_9BACT
MVFSSPFFLFLFLPAVLTLYFIAPHVARNAVLLLASLLFYAWGEPRFIVVLLASVSLNYALGLLVERYREGLLGKAVLFGAVALNIGLLLFYKYAVFAMETVEALRAFAFPGAGPITIGHIELPLGISFFTFHQLSYVIDVRRRHATAQRNPFRLALYIAFFPQLIAGPIVRYHEIAHQLVWRHVDTVRFAAGAERFILGLGKKMLIANTVAVSADAIFALPADQLATPLAWLGIVCYSLQIYFDFSGYSDMAVGLAALFGFRFPENFDYPYVSASLTEFWRRWHISLSRWFRDYLYIPLGGNRGSPLRTYANLATVFFLCGLWHGASWTFVVWGIYHGVFLVVERAGLGKVLAKWPRMLQHAYALLAIMMGWVLFRADTLRHASVYFRALAGLGPRVDYNGTIYLDSERALAILVGVVASAACLPAVRSAIVRRADAASAGIASTVRVAGFGLVFVGCAIKLSANTYNPFIYFRF